MTPTEREELQALLDALCEESISAEQIGRLEQLVLGHPEAEARYVQYMSLVADLSRHFASARFGRNRFCATASNPLRQRPNRRARRRDGAGYDPGWPGRPLSPVACSWPSACGRGRS